MGTLAFRTSWVITRCSSLLTTRLLQRTMVDMCNGKWNAQVLFCTKANYRLRVFDPNIFIEGTARFAGGRVCSHEPLQTIFRGALIKEQGKSNMNLSHKLGSIDTENGKYCISNIGSCRYRGPIPEKVSNHLLEF